MSSMYELIMDLPLFKGISRDHVSAILEHNPIVFQTFEAGENIILAGEPCSRIGFIVKGKARAERKSKDNRVTISYNLERGAVTGADAMFGIDTSFSITLTALCRTSILYFTKEQYLRLLMSDEIYLLNVLNYLSRGMQCARDGATDFNSADICSLLARWLLAVTDGLCRDITVRPEFNLDDESKRLCDELQGAGIISLDETGIHVSDTKSFLEYISENRNVKNNRGVSL